MAPLPKRRRSKARQGNLKAHRHVTLPGLVECPHCHRPMRTHHVCPACGFYRGRDVLGIESEVA